MATLNLMVPDMACGACATAITEAVKAVDPAAAVEANPQTKAVSITTSADLNAVTEAISAAGYTVNA